MRGLLLVATLLLGGAVSAAADVFDLSYANAHPALFESKSKPSLPVRDASGSGRHVHQPHRVTEEFTDPVAKVIPSLLERPDLKNLHENRNLHAKHEATLTTLASKSFPAGMRAPEVERMAAFGTPRAVACDTTARHLKKALMTMSIVQVKCPASCESERGETDPGWDVTGLGPWGEVSSICRAGYFGGALSKSGGIITLIFAGLVKMPVPFGIKSQVMFCIKEATSACRALATYAPKSSKRRSQTDSATITPTQTPTFFPTVPPTKSPTQTPTEAPSTRPPSPSPSHPPTELPTTVPTPTPTFNPTLTPTGVPTAQPTSAWDKFDVKGPLIRLSHGNRRATSANSAHSWNTVYGAAKVSGTATKTWVIKIVKVRDDSSNYWELVVGVARSTAQTGSWLSKNMRGYGYIQQNGDKTGFKARYIDHLKYGATYHASDLIKVELNLKAKTLKFWKNGVYQGVAWSNIKAGTYQLAVSIGDSADIVEIVG